MFKKEDKKDREVRGGEALSNGTMLLIREYRKGKPTKKFDVSFLLDFLNNL